MNRIQTLAAALFLFSFGSFSQSTGNDLRATTPLLDKKGNPIIITNADGSQSFVFPTPEELAAESNNVPLMDENGNPIIITNADGSQSYVFPISEEQAPATNDVPLMDENGNPIIIELENGMKAFVFPEVEND